MRADQYIRLQQLEEKLLDVFLEEAEPKGWPGQGIALGKMDAKTRGDLYWTRKTAASTLVLVGKLQSLIGRPHGSAPPPPDGAGLGEGDTPAPEATTQPEGSQLDDDIAKAEREAQRLLRELQSGTGAGKAAFDEKVHGRARSAS